MFSVKYYSFIKYIFHPMLVRPNCLLAFCTCHIHWSTWQILLFWVSQMSHSANWLYQELLCTLKLHRGLGHYVGQKYGDKNIVVKKAGVFKKHLCFGLVMNFCSFYTVFKSEPRLLPFNSFYEVSGFLNVFFYAHLPSILVNSFNFLESNDPPHAAIIDIPFIFFTAIMYRKNVSCKWQHFNIASTLGIKKCTKHLSDKGFPISVNLLYGIKKCTKHLSDKGFPISVNLLYV